MSEFGLEPGRVSLRSAGPITFGPAGILFLADSVADGAIDDVPLDEVPFAAVAIGDAPASP